jgi:hypothetical protein
MFTYGIEFEIIGLNTHQAAHAVTRAGVTCHAESYGHSTPTEWKAVTDGSLTRDDSEVVSPILTDDRLNEVSTVARGLLAGGARVTPSAGFHAHLGLDGIGKENLPQLILNWYAIHQYTDLLVAPSRRIGGSGYRWARVYDRSDAEHVAELVRDDNYDYANCDRYRSLNLQSVHRHGTVEFRLHQGTLNGKKARAWVEYITASANHAMQGEEWRLNEFHAGIDGLALVLETLKPHGMTDATAQYLLARANDLGERA